MAGDHFEFGGEIAWRPTSEYRDRSRLKAFMDRHALADYDALLRRSIDDPDWFWPAVLDDLGIEFYQPYTQVLDTSRGPAWPRWCVGGVLNIVHNCLDKWIGTPVETRTAIRWEGEEGATRTLTYGELFRQVNQCANAMATLGVNKGDRVALFMPMCPELVIAFFATIKRGAVVLPLFSGYGAEAVASRLRDAEATLLVTADGYYRRGQPVAMKAVADEAAAGAPSVRHLLVVSRLGTDMPWTAGRDHRWDEQVPQRDETCDTVRTAAEDPLMIIYTSGTTGRPKGAVHSHCGFPIKAAQDMAHCFDVHDTDTMYWVTDIGWMMGPWELFGMTLAGGTAVIYDGALDYPGPDRLWALVERHKVSILGVSPTLDPGADAPRHRACSPPRSLVTAHPGLHGRAVESRIMAVALRNRWPDARADHQLLGRHRNRRRPRRGQRADADEAVRIRGAATRHCRRCRGRVGPAGAQPGGRARGARAVDGYDARFLERHRPV